MMPSSVFEKHTLQLMRLSSLLSTLMPALEFDLHTLPIITLSVDTPCRLMPSVVLAELPGVGGGATIGAAPRMVRKSPDRLPSGLRTKRYSS